MTVIRGVDSGDGIILAVFFLLAALGVVVSGVWYGSVATMVVGVAFALVVIGVWILLRDPHPVLTIRPDEIVFGRRLVVARDATGWLRIEWAGPAKGWAINPARVPNDAER